MTNDSRDDRKQAELVAILVELRDTITSLVADLQGGVRLELEMERWLTFAEVAMSAVRLCHQRVSVQGRLTGAEWQPHTRDSSTADGPQGDDGHD